ncbi:hypothetical protein [Xanthomonas theicola]|nr:hypothetical protein [Xanthomonas theicola]QNH23475.1 hypothetical protein G4Q83_00575 [Xanthomonas theicola]
MLAIGIAGTELTAQERDWLQHDAVAGVVLRGLHHPHARQCCFHTQ